MVQRMERAHAAGAMGLIATLDWSFSMGRDWGSPEIPEKVDLKTMVRMAPQGRDQAALALPVRPGPAQIPDLTAPNLAPPGRRRRPTFFGAYYEWMTTPPPSWEDVAWMREQWAQISGTPFMLKGVCRVDDAQRAVDAGVSAISVSNHGGNNLDGTPAAIRMVQPDRRRGRRPGRGADGRRRPPRLRRRQGARPGRPGGDDRPRLPVGARRQRPGRGRERPRHPARRHRLRAARPGRLLDRASSTPEHVLVPDGLPPSARCAERLQTTASPWTSTLAAATAPGRAGRAGGAGAGRARSSSTARTCRSTPTPPSRSPWRRRGGGARRDRDACGGRPGARLRLQRRAPGLPRHGLDRHRRPARRSLVELVRSMRTWARPGRLRQRPRRQRRRAAPRVGS